MATQSTEKAYTSDFEGESHDLHLQSKVKTLRVIDSARLALTGLALLMGISILGLSANTLSVYNDTHVSGAFLLPLWPDEFDLRPTVALVVCATIVTLTNIVSVLFSKVKYVRIRPLPGLAFTTLTDISPSLPSQLRSKTPIHTSLTFVAPFIGLAAAIIAMVFFYAINASETVDTLLSWTCRWRALNMTQSPHFDTLCKQSWAGVYMSILLIPVEAAVLAVAGWQMKSERHASAYARAKNSASPVLS